MELVCRVPHTPILRVGPEPLWPIEQTSPRVILCEAQNPSCTFNVIPRAAFQPEGSAFGFAAHGYQAQGWPHYSGVILSEAKNLSGALPRIRNGLM
jgi:hypothetical protein